MMLLRGPSVREILVLFLTASTVLGVREKESPRKKVNENATKAALKREANEEIVYNQQMLGALADKSRMVQPLLDYVLDVDEPLTVVDIGPAGGAITKAVAQSIDAKSLSSRNKVKYFGIEFNDDQIPELQKFLSDDGYPNGDNLIGGKAPASYFSYGEIVEGNALHLAEVLRGVDTRLSESGVGTMGKTLIVESSVLHEIFSFSPWKPLPELEMPGGLIFSVDKQPASDSEWYYHPQVVYKNHLEALSSLKETGGSLAIRDGVLYGEPMEPTDFTLNDVSFAFMFATFLKDPKYSNVFGTLTPENQAALNSLATLTLPAHNATEQDVESQAPDYTPLTFAGVPAKIVQEFMLKANWGIKPWFRELGETYCYATLDTHLKIVQHIAQKYDINLRVITASVYNQADYRSNLRGKIVVHQGFKLSETEKFPPTNMLLKIVVAPPATAPSMGSRGGRRVPVSPKGKAKGKESKDA